jgi:UrcA family protein
MKVIKKASVLSAAALIVTLGVPTLASANLEGLANENFEVSVNFSDLDLTDDSGVVALYQRLRSAAYRACGSTSVFELGSIEQAGENRQCFQAFINNAVSQIGNEKLTSYHTS